MAEITERNYFSGRDSNLPYVVDKYLAIQLPSPPTIPGLINGLLVCVDIEARLRYLDGLVLQAVNAYAAKDVHSYFFTVEACLLSMRRVVDDLVMSVYCRANEEKVQDTRKIEVDGCGSLFRNGEPTDFGAHVLSEYIGPNRNFLEILIELSNCFKHSYLLSESRAWGADFPTVLAIYAKRNDYSKSITFHNHSFGQIVMGFNLLVSGFVTKAKR
ncbi:MAG: hypothetical protein EBR49_06105 [Betaproteobacteria bacterium]|nr:hypothetical protein [Betaproteobacteria bacterium]